MLKQLLKSKPSKKTKGPAKNKVQQAESPSASSPVKKDLCDIFRKGIKLKEKSLKQLQKQLEDGVAFFEKWNESRMRLAFESFDVSMKYALFEIIYLLNVNYQKYQEWSYHVFQTSPGKEGKDDQKMADLYVEGSPCGVKGITNLSPVFRQDFEAYIQKEFEDRIVLPDSQSEPPIEGIFSIGSIGTVGHKNIDSDLDLQVQFNIQPFFFDTAQWEDKLVLKTLRSEHEGLVQRYYEKKGIYNVGLQPEAQQKKVANFFKQRIKDKYPVLFQHFYSREKNIYVEIVRGNNQKLQGLLVNEIINLMKRSGENNGSEEIANKEALLTTKIAKIQNYITEKFPEAEIYLFPNSRQMLQKGFFGSTVESKESSGGAYELILNYETLFPGIYFTPVIPSHFAFSASVNNDSKQFGRLHDFLRFGLLEGFDEFARNANFQGPTPDLDPIYVAKHSAAAYWEAFKGSFGNLPKATLNLLRFEMLLEKQVNKTNIQMVKNPDALDKLILPSEPQSEYDDEEPEFSFQVDKLKSFEDKYPELKHDPWWLRYKTLKVGYSRHGLVSNVAENKIPQISNLIDIAFALHVRISDVFTKPGDRREFTTHREKVLNDYLATAFPEGSPQRNKLHATFIGDVQTVNDFEKDLREVFQSSNERIHHKVTNLEVHVDEQTSKEVQIWYHYYKQSFQSPPNVVQRSILNHLRVPRGRLQVGFRKDKGWFFHSLQKRISVGKRFDTSILDLLPEKVTLVENPLFLNGLVHCVINGYYGIFNRGQLNETVTVVEFDRKHADLGSRLDNSLAFIRPDQIERVMKSILEIFPEHYVSYLDCIGKEREINEMMIFLNLLKYGSLSVLYRDNLNTYYVDQLEIANIEKYADTFIESYKKMFMAKGLHMVLQKFFIEKKINPHSVKLGTWVNSNSVETTHAASQYEVKEKDLSDEFKEIILQVHRRKS